MYLFYLLGFLSFATAAIAVENLITSKTEYEQAIAYSNGVGVSQDSSKAFDLFLQCAKRGDPRAEYKVGVAYFNGDGVLKDQVEGLAWMYNAVGSGISGAVCASMEEAIGSEMCLKAKERAKELSSPLLVRAAPSESLKSLIGRDSGNVTPADLEKMAIQIREKAVNRTKMVEGKTPAQPHVVGFGKYPWHRNIKAVLFWIGMRGSKKSASPRGSAWDPTWFENFGGYDNPDPSSRRNFIPIGFTPRQNPFYCALPYNDIENGATKSEASSVVPWFNDCYQASGRSVLKGRWVAIHHGGRTCFAQFEDCVPHPNDDWEYVFGCNRPKSSVGIVVSPAIRDYLGLAGGVCDWKFIEAGSVPDGPWKFYGDNNTFVLKRRAANLFEQDPNNAKSSVR
jgi:hypothetical protein